MATAPVTRATPAMSVPMAAIWRATTASTIDAPGATGGRSSRSGPPGSVLNATPGRPCVSMLIQRIWPGSRGTPIPRNGPTSIVTTSASPPEIPKRRNLRMFA